MVVVVGGESGSGEVRVVVGCGSGGHLGLLGFIGITDC